MLATLTFTRPGDVVADDERPGLLRARHPEPGDEGDVHVCDLHDLTAPAAVEPTLEEAGFETVDLSANPSLQRTLADVRELDHLTDEAAAAIRESLTGTTIGLQNGKSLKIDHVADDGLFHRRAGPNGLEVNPGGIDGINGHSGAEYVHGDQDVFGTPLRQLMHGAAPDMFRHVTPDGRNDDAPTFLLNLWIPLHAPVQPLALMDQRTLDAKRHQLRYGLPVDGFLDREDDATVNDIWSFLHDDDQQWYFRSTMGPDQGYVFNTLGTAHGAAVLPGEAALEEVVLTLQRLCDAVDGVDPTVDRSAGDGQPPHRPPADATPEIRAAWEQMAALVDSGRALTNSADPAATAAWRADARIAIDRVIRRSIEMRLVATLTAE